ncbi:MAG: hypothetical protein H6603_06600 [Flavobacteriales bacterium]|nr:hypothetical protein [Flavobacteriales bacterium]MCB9204632.1 hypothetical protein [Flavobacteriales bacterium]
MARIHRIVHLPLTKAPTTMKYALTTLCILVLMAAQAQVKVSDDTLHWNANRPLEWADFKGEPDKGGMLEGQILCMNIGGFKRQSAHHLTVFKTVSVFDRKNSWMPENKQTDAGLKYFQVMFNIYELHSRKMREAYALSRTAEDPDVAFKEKYSQSANERSYDLNMYKAKTKYGMDTTALETWRIKIDDQLKALAEYEQ